MTAFALLVLGVAAPDWVPARWPSSDPKSLDLLEKAAINCLVVPAETNAAFRDAAQTRKLQLAVLGKDVPLFPRNKLPLDSKEPVIATEQAVWPGINTTDDENKAMPSGAPWIDTNQGFLRFARAATRSTVWLANQPPKGTIIPVERYLQAIADAAAVGARWVVSFDDDFSKRLLAREEKALKDWQRINDLLRFYENHPEWRNFRPAGQLSVIQDVASGGLLSGGVLDMISTRHTPVRPIPGSKMAQDSFQGATIAVNVDPGSLSTDQKAMVTRFTRGGGTILQAPPGWKMPEPRPDQVTLDKTDVEKLDQIWKEVNGMIGRRNLGARLFNVSSMLSDLTVSADEQQMALYLINYASYAAEDITAHLLGKFSKATLYTPEEPPKTLHLFEVEDGTGAEIPKISVAGTIVFETIKPIGAAR